MEHPGNQSRFRPQAERDVQAGKDIGEPAKHEPVERPRIDAARQGLSHAAGLDAAAVPKDQAPGPNLQSENAAGHQSALVPDVLGQKFDESELMLGLVGATGTELRRVGAVVEARLKVLRYSVHQIQVSEDILKALALDDKVDSDDQFERTSALMDIGDRAREKSEDHSILALGVAAKVAALRKENGGSTSRQAYIISSLKHPDEVLRLREIYPEAFYLIGVHADEQRRRQSLMNEKRLTKDHADALIHRDEDEHLEHGQRTSDTFHMSDFFIRVDGDDDQLKNSIWRFLDVLFADPYKTPTFDEYAMFMAFAASVRTADLSRQVGAVVAKDKEILAAGANECPCFGGGLYWPEYDRDAKDVKDAPRGRDYMRGEDANKHEQQLIIDDVIRRLGDSVKDSGKLRELLKESRIGDLTEFGRVVHAEMEALLCCARNHVSTRGATIYCTTFPCHNCAKHIIAAGISRVVYVEPYPKSKAPEFHDDSISLGFSPSDGKVRFEPFVGLGPRRFFDLFSMRLGSGYSIKRKKRDGKILDWKPESANLRTQMLPYPYLEVEKAAAFKFNEYRKSLRGPQ